MISVYMTFNHGAMLHSIVKLKEIKSNFKDLSSSQYQYLTESQIMFLRYDGYLLNINVHSE